MDCYYRLVAWTGTPIARDDINAVMAEIYDNLPRIPPRQDCRHAMHKLALLYIVFALGDLLNMEIPPNDPQSKQHFALAQQCLFSGCFLMYNTLTCVQVLVSLTAYKPANRVVTNGQICSVGRAAQYT